MPKRIQFKRQKGFKLPENCVRVTRPSRFGNPFKIGDSYKHAHIPFYDYATTAEKCLEMFETYLRDRLDEEPDFLAPLKGKDVACFCPVDSKCHGDILLKYANRD